MIVLWHVNTFCTVGLLWRVTSTTGACISQRGQLCVALMLSLLLSWTSWWTNNRFSGELRCFDAHMTTTWVMGCNRHICQIPLVLSTLQWRHNGHDSVSNHQPRDCLLKRVFIRRSKKTLKLRVTGLCVGNSPGTGEFPAQMASNAENVSIWWRHHENPTSCRCRIEPLLFDQIRSTLGSQFHFVAVWMMY